MTSSTTAALTKSRREEESGIMGWNLVIESSIAAASAATATAATTRESSGCLRRRAVTGAIRRAEHRKLNRVLLPRALRAGNLLRLVQHNLLKVRLAILANVFVNRHCVPIFLYKNFKNSSTVMPACRMMLRKTGTDKSNRSCRGTVTRSCGFPGCFNRPWGRAETSGAECYSKPFLNRVFFIGNPLAILPQTFQVTANRIARHFARFSQCPSVGDQAGKQRHCDLVSGGLKSVPAAFSTAIARRPAP